MRQSWSTFFIFLALTPAASVHADLPPYVLKQIENPKFTDHTLDLATTRLHVSRADLTPYQCDGKQEYTLLPALLHSSSAGTSLRIKASQSESTVVYQSTVNAVAELSTDPFVEIAFEALKKIASLPSGKVLLDRLEHSPYPLTITGGDTRFVAYDDAGKAYWGTAMAQAIQSLTTLRWEDGPMQFDHIGAGGRIRFDPKAEIINIESDGEERVGLSYVNLAHEMFHAFDAIRGLYDGRIVDGPAYEIAAVTEYRASYFENRIREESGLHYRKYYGDGTDGTGSLLDENGRPKLIPSPCLGTPMAEAKQ